MNPKLKCFLMICVALGFLLPGICCKKEKDDQAWMDILFENGRETFYTTVKEKISSHPKKDLLTEAEITKILETDTKQPRLYGLLINIFYQKDEPLFQALLEKGNGASRSRFRKMYLELAEFSANMFIEAFFATTPSTDLLRKDFPKYKDLDAFDLVIRSLGYNAKLDAPEVSEAKKPLSPEFDKQGALDAARFREAHAITKGAGAKIAILDTGIDMSHPIFKETKWGRHFSLVGREGKPWATDAPLVDWGWHGTLISSVAARFAPEAEISVYKFGDGDTQNDPAYQLLMQCMIAASVYKAVHDGNDIISISASGASLDVDYLREACQYAFDRNCVVVSGGLYSRWYKQGNVLNFPAQYDTVFTVTAAEKRDDGTYGYWDVCAPGETNDVVAPNDIFGAFPTYVGEEDAFIPSISAAIPVVDALFALVISEYPRTGEEVPGDYVRTLMRLVRENANPQRVGFDGFTPECGYGMIDAEKTVKSAALLAQERAR
ncbi:MAG: S8 family serine peptidase [Candidatus Aminicenantes bacterium]|nr:S8 family serine peptidase [Candidatus Aminicenantes bacterium]